MQSFILHSGITCQRLPRQLPGSPGSIDQRGPNGAKMTQLLNVLNVNIDIVNANEKGKLNNSEIDILFVIDSNILLLTLTD